MNYNEPTKVLEYDIAINSSTEKVVAVLGKDDYGRSFAIELPYQKANELGPFLTGAGREFGNLHAHAIREMELAGVEEDVRPSILAAVDAFASYGHSGGSASVCIPMLNRLLNFKTLSPITSDPREWNPVAEHLWQSNRRSTSFSRDHGKTWYDIDDPSLNNGDIW